MSRFGLYVVDATEDLDLEGYSKKNKTWVRSELSCDGQLINKTAKETNKLGLYIAGNRLKLNGSTVAVHTCADSAINIEDGKLRFGDVDISYKDRAIPITLENYNKLRSGKEVTGYTRYNPKAVYYISDAEDSSQVIEEAELDNRIANRFSVHNELSDRTVLSIESPEIILKTTNFIINEGEKLQIDWLVDNRMHDAIDAMTIGEKFTTIIRDGNDNIIFQQTTYAGEYRAYIGPFKNGNENLLGQTHISISCIDEQGRGSIEQFATVYIRSNTENIYNVTEEDLEAYHIVAGTGRRDYVQGYKNRKGFEKLINDVASGKTIDGNDLPGGPYTGIRLYNANSNPQSLDDEENSVFRIDCHKNRLVYDVVSGDESTIDLCHYTRYFLVYFAVRPENGRYVEKFGHLNNNGVFVGTEINTSYDFPKWDDGPSDTSALDAYELLPGKTVYVRDKAYTVPVNNTDDTDADFVFDWVRHDGAHIYAKGGGGDDANKTVVYWSDVDPATEVMSVTHAKYSYNERILRTKSIHDIQAKVLSGSSLRETSLREKEGFYYLALSNVAGGISGKTNVEPPIVLPNNFTVDFNYTTWASTDLTELDTFYTICLFENTNVILKNCRISGDFTPETVKDAFVRQAVYYSCWEGGSTITLSGARFCTFDNVETSNICGYNLSTGSSYDYSDSTDRRAYLAGVREHKNREDVGRLSRMGFNILGYISPLTGDVVYNNDENNCVLRYYDNGNKIPAGRKEEHDKYSPNGAYYDTYTTDICTVTTGKLVNGVYTPDYWVIEEQKSNGDYGIGYNYNYRGKRYHVTPSLCGMFVSFFSHRWTQVMGTGKYQYFLVHFYDENKDYIRSVKTRNNFHIYPPEGAVYFNATGYGACTAKDTDAYATLISEQPNDYVDYGNAALHLVKYDNTPTEWCTGLAVFDSKRITEGCVFNKLTVHTTKSIALNGPQINSTYSNCYFYNIETCSQYMRITPHLMDIEEACCIGYGMGFINCTCLSGNVMIDNGVKVPASSKGYSPSQSGIACPFIWRRLFMKGCTGISVFTWLDDSIIEDSSMSDLAVGLYYSCANNYHNVYRRLRIVGDRSLDSSYGLGIVTDRFYNTNKYYDYGVTVRNPCDDAGFRKVTLEDCSFYYRGKADVPNEPNYFIADIKGRVYNDATVNGSGIVDINITVEQQEINAQL